MLPMTRRAGNVAPVRPPQSTLKTWLCRIPAPLVLGFSILLLWPAESLAAALVRFVHAVPSAGKVTVEITQAGSTRSVGAINFAQTTPWRSVRSGQFEWALVAGGKTLAHGSATVGSGAYDLVLLAKPLNGVSLGVFKAQGGQSGKALVRVIHAAPELGTPQMRVDSKLAVPSISFTQATPYLSLAPGVHTLSATPAHSKVPLLSAKMTLAAGTAYSEIVVGSQGQQVRLAPLVDRGAALTRPAVTSASTSSTSHPAAASGSTVMVRPGDSLWKIARERLGPTASNAAVYHEYVSIWNLNSRRIGTGDPNLIFPGQDLTLPSS